MFSETVSTKEAKHSASKTLGLIFKEEINAYCDYTNVVNNYYNEVIEDVIEDIPDEPVPS